ncbi:glycosyltransferase family 2 protein [candidate division KSB1 bacterium]|nr:glycosyltransferase family 2 protein [candidate division KSB1 bacterium]
MNQLLFSIIIVNWNTADLMRDCLNSIPRTKPDGKYEIIVVDNASNDDSVAVIKQNFPDSILITNTENLGFARATNIGIKASRGEIILLLNSDAELKSKQIFEQVERFLMNHADVGIVGVSLIFPDGMPQASGGKFVSNWELFKQQILFLDSPLFHRIKRKLGTATNSQFYSLDYVTGACLFVRRRVLDEIGLLDENFYIYGEDMEFCYRARQHGWRSVILPSLQAIHLKSQSTKKNLEQILIHSIKNNCFLIEQFYGKKSAIVAHLIYSIGLCWRFFLAFVRRDQKPSVYLKLIVKNFQLMF